MLPLDPPPRRGHRHPAHWVGFSAVLHGLLVIGVIAAARYLPEYLPVQAGGAVMVSLANMGGASSGGDIAKDSATLENTADAQVESTLAEKAKPDPPTRVAPQSEQAVSIKKQAAKPRPVEKEPADKQNATAQNATVQRPHAQQASPAPTANSTMAASRLSASGTIDDRGAANSGAGSVSAVQEGAAGSGDAQPQLVLWNSSGGPQFLHQAPLRYPRSAQRRNLEGKAVVEAYLDMQGKLLRARVLQADHEDFADAALACVQSSSFKPAQREGKAIPCVVRIPMLFVLKGL